MAVCEVEGDAESGVGEFEGDGEGEFAVYGAGSGEYGGVDFDLMVGVIGLWGGFLFFSMLHFYSSFWFLVFQVSYNVF